MDTRSSIHIGTGQGKPAFTKEQVDQIEIILNRYFKGWQGTDSTKNWDGHLEKIRTYTLTNSKTEHFSFGTQLLAASSTLQACASQLRELFPDAIVIIEQNGKEITLHSPGASSNTNSANSSKLKPLPRGLPERTRALTTLDENLAGLNDLYWLLRAAIQDFTSRCTNPESKLSSFVNASVLNKLDITCADLKNSSEDIELRMRHMMITSAVSYHEDYLATVLEDFFIHAAKPDRYINIGLRLNEIGPDGITKEELERRAAKTVVAEIINSKYQDRFNKIAKFIRDLNGNNVRDYWDNDKQGAAPFEVRNCIIHSAGVADTRAVAELQWLFPDIQLGKQLPISEGKLWELLGALRDVARAIDATIRRK